MLLNRPTFSSASEFRNNNPVLKQKTHDFIINSGGSVIMIWKLSHGASRYDLFGPIWALVREFDIALNL